MVGLKDWPDVWRFEQAPGGKAFSQSSSTRPKKKSIPFPEGQIYAIYILERRMFPLAPVSYLQPMSSVHLNWGEVMSHNDWKCSQR